MSETKETLVQQILEKIEPTADNLVEQVSNELTTPIETTNN